MDIKNKIIELIENSNKVFRYRNDEINIRCPLCKDSVKSESHAHFYIKVPVDDRTPWVYFCHRCNRSGILDTELLKSIIDSRTILLEEDSGLFQDFSQYQNKNKRNLGLRSNNGDASLLILRSRPKLQIYSQQNKLNSLKLDYINERLGVNLSFKDLKKFKIILDLNELNQLNELHLETNIRNFSYISKNYLGFISHDNQYGILRYVGDKIGNTTRFHSTFNPLRYLNIPLFNETKSNKDKFYIIPNKINSLCDTLVLNITEGIFDILGVFHHIKERRVRDNELDIAVCGFSYKPVLDYITALGFINLELNLFMDSDKLNEVKRTIGLLRQRPFLRTARIRVFYNRKSKDFGVSNNEIAVKELRV